MVNLKRVADQAKKAVEKRGGTDALKDDLNQLKGIATGKGSIKDKAKAAAGTLKETGKRANPRGSATRSKAASKAKSGTKSKSKTATKAKSKSKSKSATKAKSRTASKSKSASKGRTSK